MQKLDSSNPVPASLEGTIVCDRAGKTLDMFGNRVGAGSHTWRLELVKGTKRFNVEVLSPSASSPSLSSPSEAKTPSFLKAENLGATDVTGYVLVKFFHEGEEDHVYVKRSDLAQRLHLQEDEIIEHAENGTLEALIVDRLTTLPTAIAYSKKTQKAFFTVHNEGERGATLVVEKKEKKDIVSVPTGLTTEDLMKISKAAANGLNYFLDLSTQNPKEIGIRIKGQKLKLYELSDRFDKRNLIGSGQSNLVFAVFAHHRGEFKALKISRAELKGSKHVGNDNQTSILTHLNSLGGHSVVEKPPKMIQLIHNYKLMTQGHGSLSSLKLGDLAATAKLEDYYPHTMPMEVLLENMQLLVDGMVFMHEAGVVHGDIKSENILIHPNQTFIFGDYEGSIFISKPPNLKEPYFLAELGTLTSDCTPLSEMWNALNGVKTCNFATGLLEGYRRQVSFELDMDETLNVQAAVRDQLRLVMEELQYVTDLQDADESRLEVLKERAELLRMACKEADEAVLSMGFVEPPDSIDPKRLEFLENLHKASFEIYAEERKRLETFQLGIVFCELLTNGLSPLHYPKGVKSPDSLQHFMTPYYYRSLIPRPPPPYENQPFPTVDKKRYTFEPFREILQKQGWPPEVADAIEKMLDPNPFARPSDQEINSLWKSIQLK